MFSSTTFLVVFSVVAACLAKPIKFSGYKCAYSKDSSGVDGDLSKCHSCNGYSSEALLQKDNWFEPIFLICIQSSNSLEPQESEVHKPRIVD